MSKTRAALGRRAAGAAWRARLGFGRVALVAWILVNLVHAAEGQTVEFTATPAGFSNVANPTFRFAIAAGTNGANPCATQHCSFQCQLDQDAFQDCSGGTYSVSDLTDGSHLLTVHADTPNGTLAVSPSMYSWAIDTVAPTASLVTDRLFTSAVNITVNVTFTEECSGGRAFQCSNTECDLVVRGPALAYPSTFVVISPGIAYSLQVGLSTQVPTGKVTLTTQRHICSDAAGNRYQRSVNSTIVVRFDRIQPTLNLWTPIPNAKVLIGGQDWTAQATNVTDGLPIYLDFSEPIVGTAAELQSLLNVSHGTLSPLARKSRGNRRFAFSLSWNNTGSSAAVTVTLPGNLTASRYGVPVLETATVSFLHDIDRPRVLLSTTARAHTRNQLVPVVIQFTAPVFTFNNSGVTLSGGVLQSFREIAKTTYALVVYAMDSSTVGISVAEDQTLNIAGNSNVASSVLQIKHYSSTPAVSIALYSFMTAGILGTAFFSGALAISSANLAAAGAVLGGSCIGADASKNLLGMVGHVQVLALTSFLAVSLPVEYYETVNGLQWLIPHFSTPWQKNEDVNYTTSFDAANAQMNLSLSIRRSLLSASHVPTGVAELQLQAVSSPCRMMRQWPAQYGKYNCSLYSESLATTYRSGTYSMEDFLPWKQEWYESQVQGRRRLGANGTEYGPAVAPGVYNRFFLNQDANLSRLKDELLARKYTGWNDFWRNIFWLGVVCGGVILLHILLLLFLRWRTRTPLLGALSIPRFELFLLILVLPAICQASAFVIRGGTKAGVAVGVMLLIIPALLLLMTIMLLTFGIYLGKRVQYKELRPHPQQDGMVLPPPTGMPLSLVTGAGYPGRWTRKEATSLAFIPRYGILFEDRKGPPRLATMIDDTNSSQKNTSRSGLRRNTTMTSDDEHDELAVSRAYTAYGCFQSAYILVDILRRIALGLIFGAFLVTDESWTQVSLALAVTAAQFLYLVIAKPFQRRFVQFVETVSLLCEIGIFIAAMVILAQDRPYEDHFGIGVFLLALLVLSFVAQIANEWFALIRQLLALSNTEEISPKEGLKAFAIGLVLPLLPRSRWPLLNMTAAVGTTTPPPLEKPPPPPNLDVASTSSGQYRSSSSPLTSPLPGNATATATRSPSSALSPTESSKPVATTSEYWPGEDLQEWARQNSLERRRQETELIANALVQEIMPEDPLYTKYHLEAPTATAVSKSRQRRSRIHSDSLSDIVLSDGGSQELTHSRQHSIDIGPSLN